MGRLDKRGARRNNPTVQSVAARPSSILILANRTARGAFLFCLPLPLKPRLPRGSPAAFFTNYKPAAIDFSSIKMRDSRWRLLRAKTSQQSRNRAEISRNSGDYSGGFDLPGLCEQLF